MAVTGTSSLLRTLKARRQYLHAARGRRAGSRALSLQVATTPQPEFAQPGIGLTVTKKVGNSPERNRIKRRLRAAAKACENRFHSQHDYVLIGRRAALEEPFDDLVTGLGALIDRVHKSGKPAPEKRNR